MKLFLGHQMISSPGSISGPYPLQEYLLGSKFWPSKEMEGLQIYFQITQSQSRH